MQGIRESFSFFIYLSLVMIFLSFLFFFLSFFVSTTHPPPINLELTLTRCNRVEFSGVTTTTVNSTITCETVDGQSWCTTADPGYTWVAPISDVTWGKSA